jgi:SAM-dependent methyltransferase
MSASYTYIGNELELFAHAQNWKRYFARVLRRHIRGQVLEAGAGMGSNTMLLYNQHCTGWTWLEPDARLFEQLIRSDAVASLPCEDLDCIKGDTTYFTETALFDCVLYIDVLEHIEADAAELQRAAALLKPGGKLIVLAPAHNYLFSPFDTAIGHYRRYDKKMLRAAAPASLKIISLRYYDSIGFFASLMNKWLLKQEYPTAGQIRLWDKLMVPLSRITDVLTGYRLGKTVIGVWQQPD